MDLVPNELAELADDERRLHLLVQIARSGGKLKPQWLASDKRGFAYFRSGDLAIDRKLDEDVRVLSRGDYITASFFERITRCPRCSSHSINIREICPSCGSANLSGQPMLHHFRCGFVAPIEQFGQDSNNQWQCPKCNRSLKNLGTDYEYAGDHFSCRSCFASFQEAETEGFCLSCQTRTQGPSLDSEDVLDYRLSPLGASAIRLGRLFTREDEQMMEGDLPIYRRRVMVSLMSDELRRKKRYKVEVSFLLVEVDLKCEPDQRIRREELFLKKLAAFLRDVDAAGRYEQNSYAISLPATPLKGAEVAVQRLIEHFESEDITLRIELLNTNEIDNVPDALNDARNKIKAQAG